MKEIRNFYSINTDEISRTHSDFIHRWIKASDNPNNFLMTNSVNLLEKKEGFEGISNYTMTVQCQTATYPKSYTSRQSRAEKRLNLNCPMMNDWGQKICLRFEGLKNWIKWILLKLNLWIGAATWAGDQLIVKSKWDWVESWEWEKVSKEKRKLKRKRKHWSFVELLELTRDTVLSFVEVTGHKWNRQGEKIN